VRPEFHNLTREDDIPALQILGSSLTKSISNDINASVGATGTSPLHSLLFTHELSVQYQHDTLLLEGLIYNLWVFLQTFVYVAKEQPNIFHSKQMQKLFLVAVFDQLYPKGDLKRSTRLKMLPSTKLFDAISDVLNVPMSTDLQLPVACLYLRLLLLIEMARMFAAAIVFIDNLRNTGDCSDECLFIPRDNEQYRTRLHRFETWLSIRKVIWGDIFNQRIPWILQVPQTVFTLRSNDKRFVQIFRQSYLDRYKQTILDMTNHIEFFITQVQQWTSINK